MLQNLIQHTLDSDVSSPSNDFETNNAKQQPNKSINKLPYKRDKAAKKKVPTKNTVKASDTIEASRGVSLSARKNQKHRKIEAQTASQNINKNKSINKRIK